LFVLLFLKNFNKQVKSLFFCFEIKEFLILSCMIFIGSEYKIKIEDRYNYIDLLLFNIKYNSYVVVELKVTEFKVEYILQVQKYMIEK